MVIGTQSSDWNVNDMTAEKFKQSCQFQRLINDGTTIVDLDSLADPQSNWFEIELLSDMYTKQGVVCTSMYQHVQSTPLKSQIR
jgi:hypothetical protein